MSHLALEEEVQVGGATGMGRIFSNWKRLKVCVASRMRAIRTITELAKS